MLENALVYNAGDEVMESIVADMKIAAEQQIAELHALESPSGLRRTVRRQHTQGN
eukprot:COSAG01_NODE_30472_length_615_cov_1.001938_1_plen_54_part_10